MHPENKIKKLIIKSDITTDTQTEKRILGDAMEHLDRLKLQRSPGTGPYIWRIIMKNPMTKIAAAAIIIIVGLFVINQFGGSVTSLAWADVVEKLDKIHSYIYREKKSRTSGTLKEGFEFVGQDMEQIIYISEDYGRRTDSYRGGKLLFNQYVLPSEHALISVLHSAKECIRYSLPSGEFGGIDPREMVKYILSNDYTELGRDTIDGVLVEGVELIGQKISGERLDDAVTRLWVNVETGLPVRIELEGLAYQTSTNVFVVQDQFQWNVELLASDFEPNIPPDYSVVERELPTEPKSEGQLATAESHQEPNLPDLGELSLLGLDDNEPDVIVPLVGMNEIWRAQDEIVGTWPDYSDVTGQLYEELVTKLEIDILSDDRILATAVALREKFWEAGGCLSKKSYPYGYAARLLLESAHIANPEDMTVTDELVETIQSVELAWKYGADPNERIRNVELRDTLMQFRMEQFEQIKRELEEGHAPVWEDFVRVNDLALLLGLVGDFESALNAAEWLIQYAEQGGWSAYMEPLEMMQANFKKGERFGYNISVARKVSYPENSRYARRLPSFKGPKKRGTVPLHLLEENPVWH